MIQCATFDSRKESFNSFRLAGGVVHEEHAAARRDALEQAHSDRRDRQGRGADAVPGLHEQSAAAHGDHRARPHPANDTDRTAKAFFVPADDIKTNKYDLSINRYKEVVYEEEIYDPPQEILARMIALNTDIVKDMAELEEMLG